MTDFTGFTPETIDFLWELRMNNNKAWMEENRERYRTVLKEPFDALSAALTKKFLEKKNVPQMDFSISRINRDVRFSKDKMNTAWDFMKADQLICRLFGKKWMLPLMPLNVW